MKQISGLLLGLSFVLNAGAAPVNSPSTGDVALPAASFPPRFEYDGVIEVRSGLQPKKGSGKAMVCMNILRLCQESELLTPEQALKRNYPKATYVGFLMGDRDLNSVMYIYFKSND